MGADEMVWAEMAEEATAEDVKICREGMEARVKAEDFSVDFCVLVEGFESLVGTRIMAVSVGCGGGEGNVADGASSSGSSVRIMRRLVAEGAAVAVTFLLVLGFLDGEGSLETKPSPILFRFLLPNGTEDNRLLPPRAKISDCSSSERE